MQNQGTGGTAGILIGGMLAARTRFELQNRDIRDAERRGDDNEREIGRIRKMGALKRSTAAPFSDLAVGINYPVIAAGSTSGPFATPPSPVGRPVLNEEDLVVGLNSWPMPTNAYDAQGNLLDTQATQDGGFVVIGEALGFAEVLAMLAGSTRETKPTDAQVRDIFRFHQALQRVLIDINAAEGGAAHASSYFLAAWRRFFGNPATSSTYPAGLVWSLAQDSSAVTLTTEQTFIDIPIPAGLLAVGEAAEIDLWSTLADITGTPDFTLALYLNDELVGNLTEAMTDNNKFASHVSIIRRADDGVGAVFAVGGDMVINQTSAALQGTDGIVTLDHSVANRFSIRGSFSTASSSIRLAGATLKKL